MIQMILNHSHDIRTAHRRSAFSMAEMLVVLVIIGTLSAVAVPRYAETSSRQRLDGAVRRLITDLNGARDRARFTSTAITIWIDLVAHEYRIDAIEDPDHPGSKYAVSLIDEPYKVNIIAADFGGVAKFTYDGYGEIVTSGYIDLQIGNHSKRIKVGESIIRDAIPVAIK